MFRLNQNGYKLAPCIRLHETKLTLDQDQCELGQSSRFYDQVSYELAECFRISVGETIVIFDRPVWINVKLDEVRTNV